MTIQKIDVKYLSYDLNYLRFVIRGVHKKLKKLTYMKLDSRRTEKVGEKLYRSIMTAEV